MNIIIYTVVILTIFYLLLRFTDNFILFPKNLGDENAFTLDLIYYLNKFLGHHLLLDESEHYLQVTLLVR